MKAGKDKLAEELYMRRYRRCVVGYRPLPEWVGDIVEMHDIRDGQLDLVEGNGNAGTASAQDMEDDE